MEDYIVLDIENPNDLERSISSIGIVVVKNNKKVDTIYSLINPEDEFDDEISAMTAITPDMVKDAPTFEEYWPKIEEYLVNYPIIGHNITYDLSVISTVLRHYNIIPPSFEYYCTLKLTPKRINLDSYALTDIMYELDVTYNAHNALADAEVTLYLFQYLDELKKITILDQRKYINKNNEEIDDEVIVNVNHLYGYTQALRYTDNITDKEISLLKKWVENNRSHSKTFLVRYMLISVEHFINKEKIDKEDVIKLSKASRYITKSNKYSKEEINWKLINSIIEMLNTNESITKKQYEFLEKRLYSIDLPPETNIEKILSSFTVG